jgi:hypothetical protein
MVHLKTHSPYEKTSTVFQSWVVTHSPYDSKEQAAEIKNKRRNKKEATPQPFLTQRQPNNAITQSIVIPFHALQKRERPGTVREGRTIKQMQSKMNHTSFRQQPLKST